MYIWLIWFFYSLYPHPTHRCCCFNINYLQGLVCCNVCHLMIMIMVHLYVEITNIVLIKKYTTTSTIHWNYQIIASDIVWIIFSIKKYKAWDLSVDFKCVGHYLKFGIYCLEYHLIEIIGEPWLIQIF